jgi:hypothetical protein
MWDESARCGEGKHHVVLGHAWLKAKWPWCMLALTTLELFDQPGCLKRLGSSLESLGGFPIDTGA